MALKAKPDYSSLNQWGIPPVNPATAQPFNHQYGYGFGNEGTQTTPSTSWGMPSLSENIPSSNWMNDFKPKQGSWASPITDYSTLGSGVAEKSLWERFGDSFRDSGFLGHVDPKTNIKYDGWGGLALNAVGGLANTFLGMKQYGLSKEIFNTARDVQNTNINNQVRLTNDQLARAQAQRLINDPNGMSVDQYLAKYGARNISGGLG